LAISQLALTLLMLRGFTNDVKAIEPSDDLAVAADFLDRSPDFHVAGAPGALTE
jgi:hypothetical protein